MTAGSMRSPAIQLPDPPLGEPGSYDTVCVAIPGEKAWAVAIWSKLSGEVVYARAFSGTNKRPLVFAVVEAARFLADECDGLTARSNRICYACDNRGTYRAIEATVRTGNDDWVPDFLVEAGYTVEGAEALYRALGSIQWSKPERVSPSLPEARLALRAAEEALSQHLSVLVADARSAEAALRNG